MPHFASMLHLYYAILLILQFKIFIISEITRDIILDGILQIKWQYFLSGIDNNGAFFIICNVSFPFGEESEAQKSIFPR